MPKVALDEVDLHFETCGNGTPLLLLPGALGSGEHDFVHQLEWFGRHFQVVAPDPRGYGRSRPPERDYPLSFYQRDCDDMLALMAKLGHQSFGVMGWSDGANIAVRMALQQPFCVRALVLWGGNSFLTREEVVTFQAIRNVATWSPRAVESMRGIYGDSLDGLWERYVTALEEIFRTGGKLYRSRLHLVHCPTLILHGERDPLVPLLHPQTLHEGISGSELHIFPDGKHNIHIRYHEVFNRLVLAFLTNRAQLSSSFTPPDKSASEELRAAGQRARNKVPNG